VSSWSCVNDSNDIQVKNDNANVAQPPATKAEKVKVGDVKDGSSKVNQSATRQEPKQTTANSGNIEIGNEIGDDLGDFVSYDPDSTLLKLSDSRGKLTLLVLWNSLCGHCVTENVKHMETYKQYHDKQFVNGDGFDIFMIGLDKERATWIEHLEKVNYPWKNEVYVIDSWKDADVRFFGIKNLPGTFLIDENGIVINKKFTATELPTLLEGYLKK